MTLTSAEHRQVQAATRRQRNALAQARRRSTPMLVRVQLVGGTILLAATSRSAPGAAYRLLQGTGGGWRCACLGYRHRGFCGHTELVRGLTVAPGGQSPPKEHDG